MIIGVWTPGLIAGVHSIPVVVPGSQPQSGYAEVFEVLKVVDDAAQIAAMISARIPAIVGGGRTSGRLIVGQVPIRETIGHDQINHVVSGDALKMCFRIEK